MNDIPKQNPQPAKPKKDAYLIFGGKILQKPAYDLVTLICGASQQDYTDVHLLFQTFGGTVGDGVWLYNFFRTCPLPLTIYNMGQVESIGTIAFLGAQRRIANKSASFMLHRTTRNSPDLTYHKIGWLKDSLAMDDARTEEILKAHVTISPEQWTTLGHQELWLNADAAKTSGIIHDIGDFSPPLGQKIYAAGGFV